MKFLDSASYRAAWAWVSLSSSSLTPLNPMLYRVSRSRLLPAVTFSLNSRMTSLLAMGLRVSSSPWKLLKYCRTRGRTLSTVRMVIFFTAMEKLPAASFAT